MKLVSYLKNNSKECVGIFHEGKVYDVKKSGELFGVKFPSKIKKLLINCEEHITNIYKPE